MEKTAMMQPLQSVAAVPRAARSQVGPPSTADPPQPVLRALSGGKPSLDRVSISNEAQRLAAAQTARAEQAGNNDRLQDAGPRLAASRADQIMDQLKERFFSRAGDENFSAKFDFNSDGMINVQDLGMLREKLAGSAPTTASPLAAASALAMLAQGQATTPTTSQTTEPVEPDSDAPAASLESIRAAFYTREGDDGFDAAADLNGDGVVNVRDLGLFRQAQGDVAEPVQPVPQPLTAAGGGYATTSAGTSAGVLGVETGAPDAGEVDSAAAAVAAPAVDPLATQQADTSGATQAISVAELRSSLLDQLRNAFFSQAGDDRFDATLDANGDGRINVADFLSVREEV